MGGLIPLVRSHSRSHSDVRLNESQRRACLAERGQAWKDAVQIVAMDPCASYRAAVREAEALPNALIVADRFHLVRLPTRRSPMLVGASLGTPAADPAWAARRRILRG
ncbi:MAG: transposase [Mycobacteriales bacterium]